MSEVSDSPTKKIDTFTIVINDEKFILTEQEIKYDSPNYFTKSFFGEFSEAKTKTITLQDQDVETFRYVIIHLSSNELEKCLNVERKSINLIDFEEKIKELIQVAEYFMLSKMESILIGLNQRTFIQMTEKDLHLTLSWVENLSDMVNEVEGVKITRLVDGKLEYKLIRFENAQLSFNYKPHPNGESGCQRVTLHIILSNSHHRGRLHECKEVLYRTKQRGFSAKLIDSITQPTAYLSLKKPGMPLLLLQPMQGYNPSNGFNSTYLEARYSHFSGYRQFDEAFKYTGSCSVSSTRTAFDLHIIEGIGFWYEGVFNILSAKLEPVDLCQGFDLLST